MERYTEYKDSGVKWLGEIPSHWEIRRTKYLWKEIDKRSEFGSEQLLSVSQYDGVREAQSDSRSESLKGYKIVKQDELVINIMLAWLGGLGVSKHEGIVSPAYCVYKLQDAQNPRFLHYLYRTPIYLAEFARHSTGIVPSRWRMYTDDFGEVLTLLPPIEEQNNMVAYLDTATAKIDEAIAQQQKMIDLLNERKQIIINNAVTKGLNPDVSMKNCGNDWLGEIPSHWSVDKFKNLFKTRTGITFTKAQIEEEGCPVISYGQIHSKENWGASVNAKLIRHIPSTLTKGKDNTLAYRGDFLFADTSEDFEGCGNCVCVDTEEPIYAGYHTILAKKDNREHDAYLAYLFASSRWRGQLRSMVNGVKVYSVTQTLLRSTVVILPPIEEQQAIADYINRRVIIIDKAISRHSERIKLLQERKQIIINDVVTGKVKVS